MKQHHDLHASTVLYVMIEVQCAVFPGPCYLVDSACCRCVCLPKCVSFAVNLSLSLWLSLCYQGRGRSLQHVDCQGRVCAFAPRLTCVMDGL